MQVAILLSPGVTAFEALGPYAVFRRVPGAEGLVRAGCLVPRAREGHSGRLASAFRSRPARTPAA